jgi:hypothetical protein
MPITRRRRVRHGVHCALSFMFEGSAWSCPTRSSLLLRSACEADTSDAAIDDERFVGRSAGMIYTGWYRRQGLLCSYWDKTTMLGPTQEEVPITNSIWIGALSCVRFRPETASLSQRKPDNLTAIRTIETYVRRRDDG